MARSRKVTGHLPTEPKGPKRRSKYHHPVVPDFTPNTKRVCVLTGASGLLGTAFIKRCSLDYQIVAIHNRNDLAPPQVLVDPLFPSVPIENPPAYSIRADLSQTSEIDRVCSEVIEKFQKVDLLINAACHRYWKSFVDPDALNELDMSFDLNVLAPLRLIHGFVQKFWALQSSEDNMESKRNVINLSSTAGSYVYPDTGQGVYSSTKAALNYASYHLANDLWDIGIRVNAIAPNTFPGIVPTEYVLDTIVALDQSADTGELVLIDAT